MGEVEDQRSHEGGALVGDCRSLRIDIALQAITLHQTLLDDILSLFAVVPWLRITHITMYPHQGQVDGSLYPAQHPLDIVLAGILVARAEETASVIRPPRDTGSLHAQSCRQLPTERLPVVAHVTRPQGRAITLDARESATSQDHRTFHRLVMTQSLIDGLVDQQGIDITHQFPTPSPVIHPSSHQVVILRFRGVLPPGANTYRQQTLTEVTPVCLCRCRREEVYPVGTRDIMSLLHHLLSHLRVLVDLRPYAEHQFDTPVVQTVRHQVRIRIMVLIEAHGVPSIFPPVLPVLYDDIKRHLLPLEAVDGLQDLILGMETLPAMDITRRPAWHQRSLAGQLPIGGDDLVRGTDEHGIVHTLCDG